MCIPPTLNEHYLRPNTHLLIYLQLKICQWCIRTSHISICIFLSLTRRPAKLPSNFFGVSQMFMRSIAYIAILALAATQGMGILCDLNCFFNPRFQSRVVAMTRMLWISGVGTTGDLQKNAWPNWETKTIVIAWKLDIFLRNLLLQMIILPVSQLVVKIIRMGLICAEFGLWSIQPKCREILYITWYMWLGLGVVYDRNVILPSLFLHHHLQLFFYIVVEDI